MPDTVKKIELSSSIQSTLQYANVPAVMTEIAGRLFNKMRGDEYYESCEKLTSVFIPDSLTEIGDYAFAGCESLTSITIPDGVTEIGGYAFYRCMSLTSITIPDSVTKIGNGAFHDCTNLTSATYKGKTYDYAHINDLYKAINGN